MRLIGLFGVFVLLVAGCQARTGNGAWNLKIGQDAKLVTADGSDITVETLGSPVQGKENRRSSRTIKAEQVKLPAGTTVRIHAIDGDDARVEIKDGPRAGSFFWVDCARLEPVPG
jgi:hypothetical protein